MSYPLKINSLKINTLPSIITQNCTWHNFLIYSPLNQVFNLKLFKMQDNLKYHIRKPILFTNYIFYSIKYLFAFKSSKYTCTSHFILMPNVIRDLTTLQTIGKQTKQSHQESFPKRDCNLILKRLVLKERSALEWNSLHSCSPQINMGKFICCRGPLTIFEYLMEHYLRNYFSCDFRTWLVSPGVTCAPSSQWGFNHGAAGMASIYHYLLCISED